MRTVGQQARPTLVKATPAYQKGIGAITPRPEWDYRLVPVKSLRD